MAPLHPNAISLATIANLTKELVTDEATKHIPILA